MAASASSLLFLPFSSRFRAVRLSLTREDEVSEIQNGLSPVDPKKVAGVEKAKAGE